MIQSFADKESELIRQRSHARKFGPDLQRMANRKLLILDAAETINDPWRICFTWTPTGPADVEITDYQ